MTKVVTLRSNPKFDFDLLLFSTSRSTEVPSWIQMFPDFMEITSEIILGLSTCNPFKVNVESSFVKSFKENFSCIDDMNQSMYVIEVLKHSFQHFKVSNI